MLMRLCKCSHTCDFLEIIFICRCENAETQTHNKQALWYEKVEAHSPEVPDLVSDKRLLERAASLVLVGLQKKKARSKSAIMHSSQTNPNSSRCRTQNCCTFPFAVPKNSARWVLSTMLGPDTSRERGRARSTHLDAADVVGALGLQVPHQGVHGRLELGTGGRGTASLQAFRVT